MVILNEIGLKNSKMFGISVTFVIEKHIKNTASEASDILRSFCEESTLVYSRFLFPEQYIFQMYKKNKILHYHSIVGLLLYLPWEAKTLWLTQSCVQAVGTGRASLTFCRVRQHGAVVVCA